MMATHEPPSRARDDEIMMWFTKAADGGFPGTLLVPPPHETRRPVESRSFRPPPGCRPAATDRAPACPTASTSSSRMAIAAAAETTPGRARLRNHRHRPGQRPSRARGQRGPRELGGGRWRGAAGRRAGGGRARRRRRWWGRTWRSAAARCWSRSRSASLSSAAVVGRRGPGARAQRLERELGGGAAGQRELGGGRARRELVAGVELGEPSIAPAAW